MQNRAKTIADIVNKKFIYKHHVSLNYLIKEIPSHTSLLSKETALVLDYIGEDDLEDELLFGKFILNLIHLPLDIVYIISKYYFHYFKIGSFVDVFGLSANLNMFFPAETRWDVAKIEDYDSSSKSIMVSLCHRFHPYAYLYPNNPNPRRSKENLCTGKIQPLGSKVKIVKPQESKEYDLIDGRDVNGEWKAFEVAANIGSSLWLLEADDYVSSEYKDSKRQWVDINSSNLAPYLSKTLG